MSAVVTAIVIIDARLGKVRDMLTRSVSGRNLRTVTEWGHLAAAVTSPVS